MFDGDGDGGGGHFSAYSRTEYSTAKMLCKMRHRIRILCARARPLNKFRFGIHACARPGEERKPVSAVGRVEGERAQPARDFRMHIDREHERAHDSCVQVF